MPRLSTSPRTRYQAGLTLIEVLIVSPMIILLIGVAIAFIVSLTGDAVQVQEKNTMVYNVQDALDGIEADVRTSTELKETTGTMPSPQGLQNNTQAFINTSGPGGQETLILSSSVTDSSPFNPDRQLVYTGSAPCNDTNPLYLHTIVYFVRDQTLYKRTILDDYTGVSPCTSVWQRNSCAASVAANPRCQARDELLLGNVTGFAIDYKGATPTGENDVAIPDSNINDTDYLATTAIITVTATKDAGGATITYSGVVRARIASL